MIWVRGYHIKQDANNSNLLIIFYRRNLIIRFVRHRKEMFESYRKEMYPERHIFDYCWDKNKHNLNVNINKLMFI